MPEGSAEPTTASGGEGCVGALGLVAVVAATGFGVRASAASPLAPAATSPTARQTFIDIAAGRSVPASKFP